MTERIIDSTEIDNWLKVACREAENSVTAGGKPFGAVVIQNGKIVGTGVSDNVLFKDPTRHAEVNAIRQAAATLNTPCLKGCILYSSCEPCPMCFGAAFFAEIDQVYYSLTKKDADEYGFPDDACYETLLDETKRTKYAAHRDTDGARNAMEMWKNKKIELIQEQEKMTNGDEINGEEEK